MANDFLKDLKIMSGQLNKFVHEIPRLAGAEVLGSIDQNFRSQSFFGAPWNPRADGTGGAGSRRGVGGKFVAAGRALLVQSGRLRRSFELEVRGLTLVIRTDAPYAQVHNEGGTIQQSIIITPQMRKFFWAKFKETKDDMWKGLALTKKASIDRTITIPQRQFMGEHSMLDEQLSNLIESELNAIFDD